MPIEKANTDLTGLMAANGFKPIGEKPITGCEMYSREWSRKAQANSHGEGADRLVIITWDSYGVQMVWVSRNGRLDRIRDYSSPRRAMSAIKAIVRCAGYGEE